MPGKPGEKQPPAALTSGDTSEGVSYEFKWKIQKGERKYIRVPIWARDTTPMQKARIEFRLRWDALDPLTGNLLLNYDLLEVQLRMHVVD